MKNIIEKKGYSAIYYKSFCIDENFDIAKPSGFLNAFDVKDSQGDIIHLGAFKKSIETRGPNTNSVQKIAYLKFHDMARPIGTFTSLQEMTKGLYFEGVLDDTKDGNETKKQYESKSINQHSIGLNYIWNDKAIKYSEDEDAFHIYDLILWEGSAVTLGSNPETPFTGFKSATFEERTFELYEYIEEIVKGLDAKTQYNVRQAYIKALNLIEVQKEAATKALLKAAEIDKNSKEQLKHTELNKIAAVFTDFKKIKI